MNLLRGTMPEHGMSREEADELVRDLSAVGIEVVRIDELRPGVFAPYYRLPAADHCYWITNAQGFRASVRAGPIEGMAPNALP
jgi:hypothetical protein